ncbi:methyltransferase, FkbM family [Butyrivibrio sp. Su6]|uniref:FkbM family methyltransferase n=1 Tax=Butyrivibrio sp. Su6 TaxID=1520810 RepID=UPI00089F43B0|nr:FkbM family methyltransferase [Butyrivibrio sp. Su6]SEF67657.1 methyltransferase, FkbM family [Butyrivibrio sp. Su6]
MKKFLKDTWEDFALEASKRKVYLFGFNSAVKILRQMRPFGNVWNIACILDNDHDKQRSIQLFNRQYEVCSPEESALRIREDGVVLICGTYTYEMATQLESLGISNYYSEFWMNRPLELKEDIISQKLDKNKLKEVKMHLSDMDSVNILDSVIRKREDGEIDYTDIMNRGKSEYFIDEYWKPFADGVYIDGGAYDGDTIEEIAFWTRNDFKRIYSFEPQVDKARQIRDKVLWRYGDKIKFYDMGLWSCNTTLHFTDGNDSVSGKVTDYGASISTCFIDEVVNEKVSFIKMDIEGSEVEALKGARQTICRDKPCMAICIYHKPSHLWEIPMMVHEMVPEYKLHIRHYGASMYGTILYAVI